MTRYELVSFTGLSPEVDVAPWLNQHQPDFYDVIRSDRSGIVVIAEWDEE